MKQLLSDATIRGLANREISPLLAFHIGRAFAWQVLHHGGEPRLIVSRDPRLSGSMLRSGLVAGIASVGVDVVDAIVLPTAGCAHLVRQTEAGGGVMITAGDRPAADNGFTFFDKHGIVLTDDQLHTLAAAVDDGHQGHDDLPWPTGGAIGRIMRYEHGVQLYLDHLAAAVEADLTGSTIVIDCAHGAMGVAAPVLLRRLGARLVELNNEPDGLNINLNSGPNQPAPLQEAVVRHKAVAGFAYDGDGGRIMAVDEHGRIVRGLDILAILAHRLLDDNVLPNRTVVAVGDTDGRLKDSLATVGGHVVSAAAGGYRLVQAMIEAEATLGGDAAGHIVMLDRATTADGLLVTIQLLHMMQQNDATLSELAAVVNP